MSEIVHAGLLALYHRGAWKGVLIEGASGVGKSDLALRAFELGFTLVADDRTRVWASQGRLFGCSPAPIAGMIEVRGVDVLRVPCRSMVEILLVAACLAADAPLERIPDSGARTLAGVARPLVQVRPLEASAPAKLHRVLSLLGA